MNKKEVLDAMSQEFRKSLQDIDATNGDVIKAMFPNIDFTEMTFTIHATTSVTSNGVKGGISYDFWKDWWNAKYKGVSE